MLECRETMILKGVSSGLVHSMNSFSASYLPMGGLSVNYHVSTGFGQELCGSILRFTAKVLLPS